MLSKSYYCSVIVPRHYWRKGLVRAVVTHLNARLQTPRRSLGQSQAGVLSTPWRKGLVRTAVTHLKARLQTQRRSLVQSHDVWTAGYYMWGNGWLCAHKSAHMWIFNKLFVVRATCVNAGYDSHSLAHSGNVNNFLCLTFCFAVCLCLCNKFPCMYTSQKSHSVTTLWGSVMRVTETHNRGFNMSKLLDYYGRLSMRVMMHHSDITVTSNCTLGMLLTNTE